MLIPAACGAAGGCSAKPTARRGTPRRRLPVPSTHTLAWDAPSTTVSWARPPPPCARSQRLEGIWRRAILSLTMADAFVDADLEALMAVIDMPPGAVPVQRRSSHGSVSMQTGAYPAPQDASRRRPVADSPLSAAQLRDKSSTRVDETAALSPAVPVKRRRSSLFSTSYIRDLSPQSHATPPVFPDINASASQVQLRWFIARLAIIFSIPLRLHRRRAALRASPQPASTRDAQTFDCFPFYDAAHVASGL